MLITYLIVHAAACFISLGFLIEKSNSPFIDDNISWWAFNLVVIFLIAPIFLLIVLGGNLHGGND